MTMMNQKTPSSTSQTTSRRSRLNHTLLAPALIASCLLAVPSAPTFAATGISAFIQRGDDGHFFDARDAWRRGETVHLSRAVARLADHPLKAWGDYWLLRMRLEADDSAGVEDFLQHEAGTYLADRLRGDWLRLLGKRGELERFRNEAVSLVDWDRELRCFAAQANGTPELVKPLFLDGLALPDACQQALGQLQAAEKIDAEDVWQRVRQQHQRKATSEALRSLAWLGPQAPERKAFAKAQSEIMRAPERYLEHFPRGAEQQRSARELVLFAVQRAAANDPLTAAAKWTVLDERFPAEEQAYGWLQIAMAGAYKQSAQAREWFARAGATALNEDQMAWRVRVALRASDWPGVTQAIAAMSPGIAGKADWTYWQGRALAAQGRVVEARVLYERAAAQPDFYGSLAAEELGRSINPLPRSVPSSQAEFAAMAARPGIQRALALIRVDMRSEGLKEWNFALRGMDDRQLLAAAELARAEEVWDRAIAAANRTQLEHDFSLRFLAPYRDHVQPKADALALDGAWVYGLLRQESRFITKAKSNVGAQGLMQVMPATAKWVAKKINLQDYRPGKIAEIGTNVTLGTHYMKMVLESLDNHPVLASAAYNAGPGRARRWRADVPLEGAIYAETIPFNETRDYVKAVMNNAAYYKALFEGKPQSLKALLGVVRSRGAGENSIEDLP